MDSWPSTIASSFSRGNPAAGKRDYFLLLRNTSRPDNAISAAHVSPVLAAQSSGLKRMAPQEEGWECICRKQNDEKRRTRQAGPAFKSKRWIRGRMAQSVPNGRLQLVSLRAGCCRRGYHKTSHGLVFQCCADAQFIQKEPFR